MTEVASVYGEALYSLAREESLEKLIKEQLAVLEESFRQEPGFLKLLRSPNLSKQERCRILDDSFRGSVEPYILNFLKILTEKNYVRYFFDCCEAYTLRFHQDNGILSVTAVTAVALTPAQTEKLTEKLSRITGKKSELQNRIDSSCLGGVRLDYDGQRLDDTIAHRLNAIRDLLKTDVL